MNSKWITHVFPAMIAGVFFTSIVHAYGGMGMGMMGYDDDSHMMGGRMGMMGGGYGMGMMGPGMMGGGYGMGMMGMLNLDDKQREQVRNIYREQRDKRFGYMKQMMEERDKLQDLYAADPLDKKAIGNAYDRIFAIKRQMIESSIDTRNRIHGLLTKEQKEQLRKWPYGRMRNRMMDMK